MNFSFTDNPVFSGLGKLVDCVWLSVLWAVCCIPVFTIGASSSALLYAVRKSVREESGYPTKSFFHAFKGNFKQGTAVWMIWLVMFAVFTGDALITRNIPYVFCIFIVMMVLSVIWLSYIIACVAGFDNTIRETLKNAFILMTTNLQWSVLISIIFVAGAALIWVIPVTVVCMPAVLALLTDMITQRIFRRYNTSEEAQTEG